MKSPKEIAEMIIKKDLALDNVNSNYIILARAYVELENKYKNLIEDMNEKSEINNNIYDEMELLKTGKINDLSGQLSRANIENDKLKKEIERYKKFTEHEFKIKEKYIVDITKLKKSREGLRSACEFYGDRETWELSGSLTNKRYFKNLKSYGEALNDISEFQVPNTFGYAHENKELTYYIAGKKAREALKADDELIGGGE